MAIEELQFTVQLSNRNIVPNSETISLPGSSTIFQRADIVNNIPGNYTLDYTNGLLRFIAESDLALSSPAYLDISYKYRVPFSESAFLKSQLEVFGEIVRFQQPNILKVQQTPVESVIRVENLNTGEQYSVTGINNNTIYIDGTNLPKTTSLTDISIIDISNITLRTDGRIERTFNIPPLEGYQLSANPVTSIDGLFTQTFSRRLIIGGVDEVNSSIEYTLILPSDYTDIQLKTGATNLRQSKKSLIVDIDYTIIRTDLTSPAFTSQIVIRLTDSGVSKIGSNDVYYVVNKQLRSYSFSTDTTTAETIIQGISNTVSEEINFASGDNQTLNLYSQHVFVQILNNDNDYIRSDYVVTNATRQVVFTYGTDYIVTNTGVFQRIPTGKIQSTEVIIIHYPDKEDLSIDLTLMADSVVVDYIYGNNTIDWTPSIEDETIVETMTLAKDTRFIKLDKDFSASADILIYISGDPFKNIVSRVVNTFPDVKEIEITPIPEDGDYDIEYTTRMQIIETGVSYYVNYEYGSRRNALIDNWAPLAGIKQQSVTRKQTFSLNPSSTKVVLQYAPINFNDILIYPQGASNTDVVSSPLDYNPTTRVLYFVPVTSSGEYIFEYKSAGFDTQSLRQAVEGLLAAYIEGPTHDGFVNLIKSFTGLDPTIKDSINNSFRISTENEANIEFKSDSLANPATLSSGVEFVPSKLNSGAQFVSSDNSSLRIRTENNFPIKEGTISFLFSSLFDGDDNKNHYFIDLCGSDPNTNRFSIYKNKANRLVFDIRDNIGALYRASVDVTKFFITECVTLQKGQTLIDFKSQLTCDGDKLRNPITILPGGNVFLDGYGIIADGYQEVVKNGLWTADGTQAYKVDGYDGYLHYDDGYLHADGYDGYPDQYGAYFPDGYFDGYPSQFGYGPIWIDGYSPYFEYTPYAPLAYQGYTILSDGYQGYTEEQGQILLQQFLQENGYMYGIPVFWDSYGPHPTHTNIDIDESNQDDLFQGALTKFLIYPESDITSGLFTRQNKIRALFYDKEENTLTIEPIPETGNYIISYVTGITAYEETNSLVSVTWNLGNEQEPYVRLYFDGKRQATPIFYNYNPVRPILNGPVE